MSWALWISLSLLAVEPQNTTIEEIASSGRCATLGETPDQRVSPSPQIAPGQAPLFTFRLYEGRSRQRFANSDLMLDDAGH
jgi:hypothetical protein